MDMSRKKASEASSRPRVERLTRDRDPRAVDRRVALDRPVHRLRVHERLVGLAGPADDRAGVERRHRPALAAVEVHRVAAAAERLDVLVDDVGAGRRRAPRVVDRRGRAGSRTRCRGTPPRVHGSRRRRGRARAGSAGSTGRPAGRRRRAACRSPSASPRRAARSTSAAGSWSRSRRSSATRESACRRRRSRSRSSCASRTRPGPGTATFASGSSRWRRSSQTRRPDSWPSLRWSEVEELRAAHLVATARTEDRADRARRPRRRRSASTERSRDLPCGTRALMPATYASMIRIACVPFAPCARRSANCCASLASVCALGRNRRPESASPKALTPGASSAAMRPGPRSSSMISCRSAAVAQPAPKATSSAVFPLTCGTPHRSRVIVTPARGRSSCDRTSRRGRGRASPA